ncbi:MAG: hypothetical protein M3P30_02025 [Chloroflexota bacterium]|nr:hypothetical protein [Chloroflexota bacterium]
MNPVKKASGSNSVSAAVEARGAQLFDEGARILAALWDHEVAMVRTAEALDFHTPRGTLAYAHVLLRAGEVGRAERAIRSVLALQETRPQDAHYGNFRWRLEELCVRDLNGVEFMLDDLIELAREYEAVLSAPVVAQMRQAIALGLAEIERLDVHPSYTNIVLSDITNSVLGGELLGEAHYIDRGARRLEEWLTFTNASGAPHEFNSATYAAVDILRLAALTEHTRDKRIACKARIAEERMWLHGAAHYHPGLAQLAGPHSRAYFDGWSGAGGYLKLVLWRLLGDETLRRETPYAPRSRDECHIGVALATLHCPDYVERWLREKHYPFEARETPSASLGLDITTYMTEDYTLGTASRSFNAGEPPELWPGFNSLHLYARRAIEPGYGALYARYIVNDKAPGTGHEPEDHWEEGQHVGVQHGNRAIVAYAPLPRAAPARSYKLSIRLLGVSSEDEVWVADRRVHEWPARIEPEQRVVTSFGEVYLALIPLKQTDMGSDAPIELNLVDGTLTLDVYNYQGPAKTFWEYRSHSGTFFKGNVRNAFVIEVAARYDFASIHVFRAHIAAASIIDATDTAHHRTIEYASEGGSVGLKYSLWDMALIERRHDGAVYAPPAARVGATDDSGLQFVQSTEPSVQLGGVTLRSSTAPQWLIADDDARRYVAINPSDSSTRISLTTPNTEIACDAFPFGRIDLDEAAGIVRIDADANPGAIRVAPATIRLVVNGIEAPPAE